MVKSCVICFIAWSFLGVGNKENTEKVRIQQHEINAMAWVDKEETHLKEVLEEIEEMIGATSRIEILDLQYVDSEIILNISEEITVYGGGNAAEYQVVKKLLDWGFENTTIESMTIYIEGEMTLFPEGSMSIPCSRESYEKYYN